MFLARVVVGSAPQVYALCGSLYFPRSWPFMSYERGAAAISDTKTAAIVAARNELSKRFSPESRHERR